MNNPSLYQWTLFADDQEKSLVEEVSVLRQVLQNDEHFFVFFRSWLVHIEHIAHGAVFWALIPAYWTFVRAFFIKLMVYFYII